MMISPFRAQFPPDSAVQGIKIPASLTGVGARIEYVSEKALIASHHMPIIMAGYFYRMIWIHPRG